MQWIKGDINLFTLSRNFFPPSKISTRISQLPTSASAIDHESCVHQHLNLSIKLLLQTFRSDTRVSDLTACCWWMRSELVAKENIFHFFRDFFYCKFPVPTPRQLQKNHQFLFHHHWQPFFLMFFLSRCRHLTAETVKRVKQISYRVRTIRTFTHADTTSWYFGCFLDSCFVCPLSIDCHKLGKNFFSFSPLVPKNFSQRAAVNRFTSFSDDTKLDVHCLNGKSLFFLRLLFGRDSTPSCHSLSLSLLPILMKLLWIVQRSQSHY